MWCDGVLRVKQNGAVAICGTNRRDLIRTIRLADQFNVGKIDLDSKAESCVVSTSESSNLSSDTLMARSVAVAHAFRSAYRHGPQEIEFTELPLLDRFDFGRCMFPSGISVRYLQLRSCFAGEPLDVF